MGGGAGINFDFTIGGFSARWSKRRGIFVPCKKRPTIERFDALGYMDGMRNVTGRFLKITDLEIEKPHPEDAAWFSRNLEWRHPAWITTHGQVNNMIWGGYIRGTKEQVFPMDVETECNAEGYFVGKLGFRVEIVDKEEFDGWWWDAFDSWSEVATEDWNQHCYDREMNYGAAA